MRPGQASAAPFLSRGFHLTRELTREGDPGPIYRLGLRERLGLTPEGRMTAFVGRRQELDLLQSRPDSARGGHGQIVGIVGEAGIGKSRLLYEFRQSLRGERVIYLDGHCRSYGSSIPYLPALEILRHASRLADTDTPERIGQKLRASISRLGMDAEAALPYLLQFLGVKSDLADLAMISPEAIQIRTFEILRRMCAAGSRERPLVLIVEDTHWIDTTSEKLGAFIANLAGMAVLLILTYRPAYRPSWVQTSPFTQIALSPLSAQESMRVVSALLPRERATASLADTIVTRAQGNPFFLEELARAVVDQGGDGGIKLNAPRDGLSSSSSSRQHSGSPHDRRISHYRVRGTLDQSLRIRRRRKMGLGSPALV